MLSEGLAVFGGEGIGESGSEGVRGKRSWHRECVGQMTLEIGDIALWAGRFVRAREVYTVLGGESDMALEANSIGSVGSHDLMLEAQIAEQCSFPQVAAWQSPVIT